MSLFVVFFGDGDYPECLHKMELCGVVEILSPTGESLFSAPRESRPHFLAGFPYLPLCLPTPALLLPFPLPFPLALSFFFHFRLQQWGRKFRHNPGPPPDQRSPQKRWDPHRADGNTVTGRPCYSITDIGRIFHRSSSSAPPCFYKLVPLQCIQDCVRSFSKYLQRWRLHSLSKQLISVFEHLLSKIK